MENSKRIYYGWFVVAASCAVMALTVGITMNCFGQFIKPVCADMGFTRQQMSLNQTIVAMVQMFMALMWGTIYRRINLRKVMCVSSMLLPVAYAGYSFAGSIWQFYIISVLVSVLGAMVSMLVITYIIGNWFHVKRGVAIGMASMGTGIGGMVMNPFINWIITVYGWRAAYRISGVLMFVVIVPCIVFVIREKPESKGLAPYGYAGAVDSTGAPAEKAGGMMFSEARKTPIFWTVALCSVGMVIAVCVFYQNVAPHLSDKGYSAAFAATITSVCMGAMAGGKVMLGWIFDKLGTKNATAFACSCTLIGVVGMIFCSTPIGIGAIVLGVGLGCSFGAMCIPLIVQNIFGMKDYGEIYGKLSAFTSLGAALAPTIAGTCFDVMGSYTPMYYGTAVLILLFGGALTIALPRRSRVLEGQQ